VWREAKNMSWLSDKMKRWEESIDRRAGEGAGRRVTAGWDELTGDLCELAEWSARTGERLEAAVPCAADRCAIMQERSCRFVEEFGDADIVELRELYRKTGSPEQVIRAMRDHPARFGDPFIEDGAIVEIRRPRDPAAFAAAGTARERQAAACFCPLIRETGERIPLEYCHCSAGWYKGIYEGIFEVPAEVSVEESLISGGDRCVFRIRVPGVL
jgi:hypothetical protein